MHTSANAIATIRTSTHAYEYFVSKVHFFNTTIW